MKKVVIKEDIRIPSTNIILENKDQIFFCESPLSNSDIYFAKQYWSDLCENYVGNPEGFLKHIKKFFFGEMNRALGLGDVWILNKLRDKLDIFLLKVADPVEKEWFGEPISSKDL